MSLLYECTHIYIGIYTYYIERKWPLLGHCLSMICIGVRVFSPDTYLSRFRVFRVFLPNIFEPDLYKANCIHRSRRSSSRQKGSEWDREHEPMTVYIYGTSQITNYVRYHLDSIQTMYTEGEHLQDPPKSFQIWCICNQEHDNLHFAPLKSDCLIFCVEP